MDQAVLLQHRYELVGEELAVHRVHPAGQHLAAAHLLRIRPHHRLVVGHDPAVFDGVVDIVDDVQPLVIRLAHRLVVFDVDVKGGCNIKNFYGNKALAIFIQPPSIEELRRRLEKRGTDKPEVIDDRIARAEYELTFAPKFDVVVVNDDLETAQKEALDVVTAFIEQDEKEEH